MKNKIDNIKEIFNHILFHCAETTEFMNKSQILELIAKEASQGIKECDELEETYQGIGALAEQIQYILKKH